MASNKVVLLIGIGIGIIGAIAVIYILKDRQINLSGIKQESVDLKTVDNSSKSLTNDNTAYLNDENWLIERNDDGSIKAINVKRDVKINR